MKHMKKAHKGTSAPQGTAVGGGSRPNAKTKHPIMSSAPSNPKTLDRPTGHSKHR
jgi:hypothetical protein